VGRGTVASEMRPYQSGNKIYLLRRAKKKGAQGERLAEVPALPRIQRPTRKANQIRRSYCRTRELDVPNASEPPGPERAPPDPGPFESGPPRCADD
jgi:hypothetical protein